MWGERLRRWERIFYVVILILAVFSRFYMLGDRAISHDESIHTKFSWNFFAGQGFQHNPMMHGPLLFEVTALNYFMFGVNDFTSRIYTAALGVLLVLTPVLFRKWLGKPGAALAAVMLLISPSISYYARYIRHDTPVMLFAVLWIWTLFQYLDTGKKSWLYGMAAFFSLMHASKEVNYIYIAIVCGLMAFPFAWQVMTLPWQRKELFQIFVFALIAMLLLLAVFAASFLVADVQHQDLDEAGNTRVANIAIPIWGRLAAALAFVALFAALMMVYYGIGDAAMHQLRLFDVLMAVGTLTLPLGSAFLIKFVAGVDMGVVYEAVRTGNFTQMASPTVAAILGVVLLCLAVSVGIGLWWDRRRWPLVALIHYSIFLVTYTSVFTWGFGALSGLVGGLAYWMAQQGVERGGQPWYYYGVVGPLYEYLPILLSIPAGVGAILYAFRAGRANDESADQRISGSADQRISESASRRVGESAERRSGESALSPQSSVLSPQSSVLSPQSSVLSPQSLLQQFFPIFLLGWTGLAWIAYTYAGEKMPWLLVHIALPSIFLAAWGLGQWLERLDVGEGTRWLPPAFLVALLLTLTTLAGLGGAVGVWRAALANGVSSAGPTLAQLGPFGQVLGGLLGTVVFGGFLFWTVERLGVARSLRWGGVLLAGVLAGLTVRTMAMANFVNYDMATEYLVYAHSTGDIKVALKQVQDISWRVTGAPYDVQVAYGEDGSWPLTWYMVDYPNNYFYGTTPDRARLLECPVVIAGSPQYGVVEEILGTDYIHFDYLYLWWPVEDYKGLTLARIVGAWRDPEMRRALWDILWRRDYTHYAQLKNPGAPFTLQTWPYRKEFRLYVRRDLAQDVWNYRLGETAAPVVKPQATVAPDPYRAGEQSLATTGVAALPNAAPRGMAVSPDGTLYVADTAQHRVWHITAQGAVLGSLGGFGAALGQFSEPWDVALDAQGNLYVADTWNHRIQKFDAAGQYVTSWGTLAQVAAFSPNGQSLFFGPRGIAVAPNGEVFVTDTGNKRVQVFDADGKFLREFGGSGTYPGLMNEPVGIAVNETEVFVADAWNRRVQVFTLQGDFVRQWQIPSWRLDNPEEKPFLALSGDSVYVTEPGQRRVLAFAADGTFRWAVTGGDAGMLTYPVGVAVYENMLYVADTHAAQVVGYRLPE